MYLDNDTLVTPPHPGRRICPICVCLGLLVETFPFLLLLSSVFQFVLDLTSGDAKSETTQRRLAQQQLTSAIKAEILTFSHQNTDGQCKCCKMLISCCHQVALCLSVSIGTKAPGLSSQVWLNFFCCSETSKFTMSSRRLHNLASRRSSD